jgi:hypothetical protein
MDVHRVRKEKISPFIRTVDFTNENVRKSLQKVYELQVLKRCKKRGVIWIFCNAKTAWPLPDLASLVDPLHRKR